MEPPHRRRPRYKGTHPRRFAEKYKELDAAKHPEVAAKVASRGKTPAGSHLPIMVEEVLAALAPRPGEVAVDCTLGHGGHARRLLAAVQPGGRLIALDVDPIELPRTQAQLEALAPPGALTVVRTNFAAVQAALASAGVAAADVLLADLGCSSMQIDDPARGFTFKEPGPLDLRLNPRRGEPAFALLARLDAPSLAALLAENADEPFAARIARALAPRARELTTTTALADAVRAVLPPGQDRPAVNATLARVFQALRIAVNDELRVLDSLLAALPSALRPGGRAAFLTFHSGEDRRVKKALQEGHRSGLYEHVSEPGRASADEVRANPRARSAKLRWCRRVDAGPEAR